MRVYKDGMKSTEISRKQIGVIYAMAKNGEIAIENWVISDFYNAADYYGFDDNGSMADTERKIRQIVDACFSNREAVQELIDRYTEETFKLLSRKNQQNADRSVLGKRADEEAEETKEEETMTHEEGIKMMGFEPRIKYDELLFTDKPEGIIAYMQKEYWNNDRELDLLDAYNSFENVPFSYEEVERVAKNFFGPEMYLNR